MDVDDDSGGESLAGDDNEQSGLDSFQKDLWQIRLFPYADELRKNADEYFSYVKTGLARAVLHRDSRPGLVYWSLELQKFLSFYGRRFTKKDHIHLVELLYSIVVAEKLDFSIVLTACNTLIQLLSRKNMLTRKDLVLDWKPMYNLYYEISYKNLEEEGVFLLPEDLKKTLDRLLHYVRTYFADDATQEILDQIRPFLCPYDEIFSRGLSLAYHFLPTCLSREEHAKFGAALWFDEFWHWYALADSPTNSEATFVQLFGKLARDSPFYIDWTGKLDVIFGQLIRSFKLEVGADRVSVWTSSNVFQQAPLLIAYNLGGENNIAQPLLSKLFMTLKNYFHPSNSGTHTQNLLTFVALLSQDILNRVSRERYHSKKHVVQVPFEYRITDAQLDKFVNSILPCLEYAAFSKVKQEYVPVIMRSLSFLSPGIVLPAVLDLVYPSLETLCEPHRLQQSLQILTGTLVSLVRDDPTKQGGERRPLKFFESDSGDNHLKSFRIHVINILESILPAIDLNDVIKSMLSLQITGILLQLIPVADCSEAVYIRNDLTEEEKELCSATARFDAIIDQLLGKLFNMMEIFGQNAATATNHNRRHNLTRTGRVNAEEVVMERGVVGVIRALLKNCSAAIYDRVLNHYYGILTTTVCDSRSILTTLASLLPVFIINNPDKAFPLLFDFVYGRLKDAITEETLQEDETEPAVIWYLTLFAEAVHGVPGKFIIGRRTQIDHIIEVGTQFKCKDAITAMGKIVQNSISSLTAFFPHSRSIDRREQTNLAEYLPIRHWAENIDKDKWTLKWSLPTDAELDYAQEMVNRVVFYQLDRLVNSNEVDKLSNNDLQKRLVFVRSALLGASKLMPFMSGKPVQQFNTLPAGLYVEPVFLPQNFRTLTSMDGRNLRLVIFERIKKLLEYVLINRENDTKSMAELIGILRILLLVRGIDDKTFQPLLSSHRAAKNQLYDPLRGPVANIESVVEDSLMFQHVKRCIFKHSLGLNDTLIEAMKLLVNLSVCAYSTIRIPAQRVLESCFNTWACSYKYILQDVLYYIRKDNTVTHDQYKGALYILYMSKSTLVNARYSDRPSIVALTDGLHDLLVSQFASFEIYFTFPDSVIACANKLMEPYEGCRHLPNVSGFNILTNAEAKKFETSRNEENVQLYNSLCNTLVQFCNDSSLHWRHMELAQSLLSLLLRRDVEYPKDAVLIFTKLLASETIRTRKTAVNIMSSWLRINKPKAIREVLNIDKGENGPGAKWPIKYGIRKDNQFLMSKTEDRVTGDSWNNTRFHTKPYIGFYTWPREYRVYAPPILQENLNRSPVEFSATEREVISLLTDRNHLALILKLLAVEEKKGSEQFSAASYSFFYGLTRTFGPVIVDAFRPFVEEFMVDKQEATQRLVAEMVAGIIKGAKLWTYDKFFVLQTWLTPLLMTNFESMRNEIEGLWAQAIVSICFDAEPRQTAWFLDLLMVLYQKPSESAYHTSVRLYFLHCVGSQWEWRSMEFWHKLFEICKPMIGHSLQTLRSRVAGVLADACQYAYRHIYIEPGLEERFRPISFERVSEFVKPRLSKMFANALEGTGGSGSNSDTEMTDLTSMAKQQSKKEKLIFLTYLSALTISHSTSVEPHVLDFIPILADRCNETKDEEIRNTCVLMLQHVMSIMFINEDQFPYLLQTVAESLTHCSWWKAKVALLKFCQVVIFSNIFIAQHVVDQICQLMFMLLKDPQLEVRSMAADTLSGYINCGYIEVNSNLLNAAAEMTASNDLLTRHAGVLALSAVILAYPYAVPQFLPDVLMKFCRYASDKQPIHATVKKTLSEFRRTHADSWTQDHKQQFNEDQLEVLTGLLVSHNYYV
ncbi:hypothetical protein M3Y94_00189800 [Aphelenchoides besseyi]|nr:hypothetical protein M3Y94_00189800 [Aphelenchoides besseyi]